MILVFINVLKIVEIIFKQLIICIFSKMPTLHTKWFTYFLEVQNEPIFWLFYYLKAVFSICYHVNERKHLQTNKRENKKSRVSIFLKLGQK